MGSIRGLGVFVDFFLLGGGAMAPSRRRGEWDARNGDSDARNGELGEAERSRDGGGEAGRAVAARRGDVTFVLFAGAPILVPARGAQRAEGRTAALWSTGVGRTETGRTTVGVGVRPGGGGGLPSLGQCAVGDGARPELCVAGAVGAVMRGAENATAVATPNSGGDIGVAGRVGGVSHARAGGVCETSGGVVRGFAPAESRGVRGRPTCGSLARKRSGGARRGWTCWRWRRHGVVGYACADRRDRPRSLRRRGWCGAVALGRPGGWERV